MTVGDRLIAEVDDVRLHPTKETEVPFVLATELDPINSHFVKQWSREEHLAALSDPNIGHYVVETVANRSLVGYLIAVGLQNTNGKIFLKRFVIANKGKGYGRQALRAFQEFIFGQLGFTCIWLNVYHHNQRARKLYQSEGYAEIGLSPVEKHIIMSLTYGKDA
jgi:diamine N-acetyltransferase